MGIVFLNVSHETNCSPAAEDWCSVCRRLHYISSLHPPPPPFSVFVLCCLVLPSLANPCTAPTWPAPHARRLPPTQHTPLNTPPSPLHRLIAPPVPPAILALPTRRSAAELV